ncbi:disease resistance protein RPS6-like [Capsella rubella]|uniref:disease resistance protein RPS6-like n=1 Tax=Capsella rubella TaxID=81985 RepID=UPI000CD4E449|nr:disease resistance protein RPS6-like [Capsella rubella]XP_023638547.1 disease resistance protein RPS6-like [Capsella rubella]
MALSSSSSCNWVYDVFPSFSGEDVRVTFLSHFLKELDRKLIIAFKDSEIERSQSLDPELKQAIRTSKIAVVVFSDKYASSSWCLDELLEIVKCKEELGQMVIPVFYGLDPSHVRKQTGKFGEAFANTCQRKTEDETKLWRQSLTDVANVLGYHSRNWPSEAEMIEAIANNVLGKLSFSPSKDFEDFVGMEDHIAKMSVLLHLESEEVRMVGIWGSSGIGKTSIARALYNQLSRRFQGSVFIDRAFVSKNTSMYDSANPDDYNMKLYLVSSFLSKILDIKDIRISHLGAMGEMLNNRKVLIFIDDIDDQMVLDTLAGQTQWFGRGSRIIVITKDKQFLRGHKINHIYEVCLPSKELALKIFCRSAFGKTSPPDGLMELASEIALCAGNLPLGLKVLGSYLRGRDEEDLIDMLPRLQNGLDGKIEKTLRVSYNGLDNQKDKAIFRHIACLFNGENVNNIKMLLVGSGLDVDIGLKNLVDKSLIQVRDETVEMHSLLQEMGKEIVRAQSNEPGEREFLMDAKDICDLLEDNTGTKKVLGITLDMDEIDELHIHENAFKGMRNLLFLKVYTKKWDKKTEVKWHLPEGFNYLPHKLRLLRLDGYPMRYMPSKFQTENLVKLQMSGSKLERLWDGIHSLGGLKVLDLQGSISLKEIPNLSMATNLEKLDLCGCSSLVELPSSVMHLNKLERLEMGNCENLETLPTGINLQSLFRLDLSGCSRLKIFPDISTNISWLLLSETEIETIPSDLRLEKLHHLSMRKMKSSKIFGRIQPLAPLMIMMPHSLVCLHLEGIQSLVELPASIHNFTKLGRLGVRNCIYLETLPTCINFPFLFELDLSGCSRLRTFPDFSTNINDLYLERTGIEEVPWWIEKFSKLERLWMSGCKKLKCVSLHISKLNLLNSVEFPDCGALSEATWNDSSTMSADNIHFPFPDNLINCFNFHVDQELTFDHPNRHKFLILSGEEVPSYFTYRTTGTSFTNIPLLHSSPSHPFFRFKVCAVVDLKTSLCHDCFTIGIHISCRFKGRLENHSPFPYQVKLYRRHKCIHLVIFECSFPLNEDNASLPEVSYDHVDVEFLFSNWDDSTSELIEWGIRLSDDSSSLENRLSDGTTLPDVCEADEDNMMINETEHSEESGDNYEETERSKKRVRITEEEHGMSL